MRELGPLLCAHERISSISRKLLAARDRPSRSRRRLSRRGGCAQVIKFNYALLILAAVYRRLARRARRGRARLLACARGCRTDLRGRSRVGARYEAIIRFHESRACACDCQQPRNFSRTFQGRPLGEEHPLFSVAPSVARRRKTNFDRGIDRPQNPQSPSADHVINN